MTASTALPRLGSVLLGVLATRDSLLFLVETGELLARHGLVTDVGEFENVVDHLLLENRRSEIVQGTRVLAVETVDLLLLARIASNLVVERPLQLLLGDLYLVAVTDL